MAIMLDPKDFPKDGVYAGILWLTKEQKALS